ncbi:MAG: hypothetical protein JOZ15_06705 [Acidobacteria bacterium]|nr:hypothetical protein [Acidobacteriota bacterium]
MPGQFVIGKQPDGKVPPGDLALARSALGYYVSSVLRGDQVKRAKLCGRQSP